MEDKEFITFLLDMKEILKKRKEEFTPLSKDFYKLLCRFINEEILMKNKRSHREKDGDYFNDEHIKQVTFQAMKRCPRCKKYPAQIDFSGKIKPCFECEANDLEEDFII